MVTFSGEKQKKIIVTIILSHGAEKIMLIVILNKTSLTFAC